jgi:hypothetical protein
MRRRLFLLVVGFSAIVLPAFADASPAIAIGTIESVSTADSSIAIRTSSGTRTGRFTPRTLISIGGMPGEIRDLRPGQSVTVHFALTRGGNASSELVRIEVRLSRSS